MPSVLLVPLTALPWEVLSALREALSVTFGSGSRVKYCFGGFRSRLRAWHAHHASTTPAHCTTYADARHVGKVYGTERTSPVRPTILILE
jgi:hypothetical protein